MMTYLLILLKNFRFDTMCGTNNVKQKEYVTNEMLQTEFKKLMRLPFIGLVILN